MGMENPQLGNTRAICLAVRAAAGSLRRAHFPPLLPPCPAQVSVQPSTGTEMGTVSANITPVRPWKLWINTTNLFLAQSFFCVQENMNAYVSLYSQQELVA